MHYIEQQWQRLIGQLQPSKKNRWSMFWSSASQSQLAHDREMALNLWHTLNLSDFMGASDLKKAIKSIETIPISDDETVGDYIRANHLTTLREFEESASEEALDSKVTHEPLMESNPDSVMNENILMCLVKTQQKLMVFYNFAKKQLSQDVPMNTVVYSDDDLEKNQNNADLKKTTAASTEGSEPAIIKDMKRQGVLIDGKKIDHESYSKDEAFNHACMDSLEKLCGDEYSDPNSKTMLVAEIGGQELQAILTDEFRQKAALKDDESMELMPAQCSGLIHWRKIGDQIVGEVVVNVLTGRQVGLEDGGKPQQFIIGSDGRTIVTIPDDQLESVLERATADRKENLPQNTVPICKIKAEITVNDNGRDKPATFSISHLEFNYNTTDIEHKPQLGMPDVDVDPDVVPRSPSASSTLN